MVAKHARAYKASLSESSVFLDEDIGFDPHPRYWPLTGKLDLARVTYSP